MGNISTSDFEGIGTWAFRVKVLFQSESPTFFKSESHFLKNESPFQKVKVFFRLDLFFYFFLKPTTIASTLFLKLTTTLTLFLKSTTTST